MRIAVFVSVAVLALCVSAVRALEVPVTVQETAGVARSAEPVSGGISLPPGRYKPGEVKLALFDGEEAVPVQVTELVVGPTGHVRWVLLDFQLDLKARQTRTLTLKDGQPAKPARPMKVTETAAGVKVDTGKIAFSIYKAKPFGLVENVSVGGEKVVTGGAVSYENGLDGKRYVAGPPETLKVHYAGPMRVTIEVRGAFAKDAETKLRYCTYITAWAGRSDILVKHSLVNSRSDRRWHVNVRGSRIALKTTGGEISAGADKPAKLPLVEGPVTLHQGLLESAAKPAKLTQGEKTVWEGKGAGGWLAVGSVWAADRLFASDPPRALAVAGDATLVLDAAPAAFLGKVDKQGNRIGGRPYAQCGDYRWIYDCSHHSSEYRIDFSAEGDAAALSAKAGAAASRVWGFAPGSWYSDCQVLAVGRFGTLADEKACHKAWGWQAGREPTWRVNPARFVGWEDNHYESEADSAEAMLLMFLRTGQRGFFDEGEAWVRYHTDIQAWRTEGWQWTDGGIWWPQGGPQGNRPVRNTKSNVAYKAWNKGGGDDRTLWRKSIAKGCYCHHYGAGLVDWFCLTGDRDALDAAVDDCEMKYNEVTHYRRFQPGKTGVGSTRGYGRGFYVGVRTWMVQPTHETLTKLVRLCRDMLAKLPDTYLDERGTYATVQKAHPKKYLTPGIKRYMAEKGITVADDGTFKDASGRTWQWKDMGGTWMIAYIQNAADMLAEHTGDEEMMDYAIGAGQFTARYMLSPAAKQTWYYTALDIPNLGDVWDSWKYDGLKRNEHGEGPRHSGWYTRFFPDGCARAYSWTGEKQLMAKGVEFWSYGNRRGYQTTRLTPKHNFAYHRPPKDDSALSTARLLYEGSHPRQDAQPPAAVKDLAVKLLGDGKAEVRFTAPADAGGGKAVRYQVKCSELPILPYEQWDYARDLGKKRNWWKAVNCKDEPAPADAGKKMKFVVSGVPAGEKLYFAVRTFDDGGNRSGISNLAEAGR